MYLRLLLPKVNREHLRHWRRQLMSSVHPPQLSSSDTFRLWTILLPRETAPLCSLSQSIFSLAWLTRATLVPRCNNLSKSINWYDYFSYYFLVLLVFCITICFYDDFVINYHYFLLLIWVKCPARLSALEFNGVFYPMGSLLFNLNWIYYLLYIKLKL